MSSKKRKQSNTNWNSGSSSDLPNNKQTGPNFDGNRSATAMPVQEISLVRTDDMILKHQIDGDSTVCQVCRKHEIQPAMSKYLSRLGDFEIVIVCDDSSSMMTQIDGTQRTRWDELRSIVETIAEIGVIFDSNGVDIYFLNRPPVLNVTDPADIARAFEPPPSGFTPLAPVLNEVFQSELARRERNKKLLVFVATDGEPTNKYGTPDQSEVQRIMTKVRCAETTYVSFLICTEDTKEVKYLNEWDTTMLHVDINDDYHTERDKIRQRRNQKNYPFSHGDYVVKALVGAVVPELDRLNE